MVQTSSTQSCDVCAVSVLHRLGLLVHNMNPTCPVVPLLQRLSSLPVVSAPCVPFASLPQACEAAEYLTKLPDRIRKLSERAAARKQRTKGAKANFAWVFDRPVELV